jgi:DinB superfamily
MGEGPVAPVNPLPEIVQALRDSEEALCRAVEELDDKFRAYKAEPSDWSVTEIVEHLTIVEQRIKSMLECKLETAEPSTAARDSSRSRAALFEKAASRAERAEAPGPVRPTGRYVSCRGALVEFCKTREALVAWAEGHPDLLTGHTLPHLFFGPLDGCEWLTFLAGHTKRHVDQIEARKSKALRHASSISA